ncbi:MAG: glycosyltransferase family 4 protein [Acidobacteria bacterium]|nr:glycosyltransferase family 4 protein [Acidobacteriota bacterium]
MKVVLASAFPVDPGSPRGGVEAVTVVLARALVEHAGLEVRIVTADARAGRVERSDWDGIEVHRLPWRARRMLPGALGADGARLRRHVAALDADVVHAHDVYGLMLRGLGAPRVLTIHGFIHADTLVAQERWARIRSVLWRRAEHAAWRSFPHIVSISPYVRERLGGIATGVIHDIDNPIAEPFFAVERRSGEPAVFSAASICPRKNTLGLVDAFARAVAAGAAATLRLAGPQPQPRYAELVRQRIRTLRLEERVVLLPPLSGDLVRRELASASVAALVSLEENAPLAVEEAMAAGVPVVTSNRCGMPYMVADGETGYLVNPLDPGDIAGRLVELLQDAPLRRRFGDRGAALARQRFHPSEVARRTRLVYERAAGALTRSAAPRSA